MTSQDTYVSQREDEVTALRAEVVRLRAENSGLQARLAQLQPKRPLKVGPPQHSGQMVIGGTEEAK